MVEDILASDQDISFRPITRQDFPLIQKWLAASHVKEWWHDDLDAQELENKYGPRVDGEEPTHVYIIRLGNKPIGLIQWYLWSDYPAHAAQLGAERTTAGMDLAIGEVDSVGKGLGSAIINEFVEKIIFTDSTATAVVTDPEMQNFRSLRAFEKAGFIAQRTTQLKGEDAQRIVVSRQNTKNPKLVSAISTDHIHLVPYEITWPDLAGKEITAIRNALLDLDFEIHHIGSTAIPGLAAKPIIDLLIGVDSLEGAKQFIEPLEKVGYSYWRENPNNWHLYFVKGLPLAGGSGRTHHVHIYQRNHDEFRKKLLFRDYLKSDSAKAKAYSDLKSKLADKYKHDREKYTDAKTDFIKATVATAEFADIVHRICKSKAPSNMTTKVIAIDGCGGAGKTTLATSLSRRLNNCPVIHTDDFASWDNSQNWYPRMLEQVLIPLSQNEKANFQKYDWNARKLGDWITIEPHEFIILEGVSAARKEFRPYLAYSIYVETNRELRLERGLERDGANAESLWLKWMKEEDEYLIRDNSKDYANVIVFGDSDFKEDFN